MSSPRQVALQIREILRDLTWPEGSEEPVFGQEVFLTPGLDEEAIPNNPPFVVLNVGSMNPDPDDPDLLDQVIDVVLCCYAVSDPTGEDVVVGGPRSGGDRGSSSGRGILEIETVMLGAVEKLTGADGTPILVSNAGATEVARFGDDREFHFRRYQIRLLCTRDDEYPAPQDFTASVAGGNVTMAWALPPDRWDRIRVYLRRASGSTPPSSYTSGTEVALSSDLATSKVDAPGAGTWSYALFVGYTDIPGSTTPVAWSSAEVGSYRAGVVVT